MIHMLKVRLLLALAVIAAYGTASVFPVASPISPAVPTAWADDDEDEDEHEDEDDEDDREDEDEEEAPAQETTKTVMKKVVQEIIEYKPVTRTYVVTDEAYQKDLDGDGLVDAIDPDPLIDQRKYFTDSDDDGLPDVLDQHQGEDDFLYYESEADANDNGILDSYEDLLAGQE